MTDKEMVEITLNNLGLKYKYRMTDIVLINDDYGENRKICSHEEIAFEFDDNGKFECIAAY